MLGPIIPCNVGKNIDGEMQGGLMDNVLFIQAIVAIVFGVLILVWPRLLNYVVGLYLIIFGILGIIRYWPF